MKKNFILTFILLLTTSVFADTGKRTDVLRDIKFHAQSFAPAAHSNSESAWEVRTRGKKIVITRAHSICEDRGGELISHSLPYTEEVSDSIYRSHAIYHSYLAIIDEAICKVDLKKEQELKFAREKQEKQYLKTLAEAHEAQYARQLEIIKHNQKVDTGWLQFASDANSVCAYILAQPRYAGYVEECINTAISIQLNKRTATIAMAGTLKNVAVAPDFLIALNGKNLSQGLAEVLFYMTWENYAYGLHAIKASQDKIYTTEEETYCLAKAKQNVYLGQTCLSETGRRMKL